MIHYMRQLRLAGAVALAVSLLASVALAANRAEDVSFDDIKFEMEKGGEYERSMLGKKIEDLEGQRIRIRGYILPSFRQKGITQFVLVRDNMECCFGPGAALFDAIIVRMAPGKTTSFSVRPIAVEGTFSIQEVRDASGKHLAIYAMTAEEVK
jgi:hypothetical protein